MNRAYQSIFSVANSASAAISLFLLFRFGFSYAEPRYVGLWALMSGWLAFARIVETGAATSLLRQTAILRQETDRPRFGPTVWAGLSIATGPTTTLASVIVFAAYFIVPHQSEWTPADLPGVTATILASFIYAFGSSASGVIGGSMDGSGRMTTRLLMSIFCNIALLFLSWILIPRFHLFGFLTVQCIYVWALFVLYMADFSMRPNGLRTSWTEYTQALRDSYKVVSGGIAIGAARAGFEPVTKIVIGHIGGLTAVAVFDLVNRISIQLRQVLSAALQPISVAAARREGSLSKDLQKTFQKWTIIALALGCASACFQILITPILSLIVFNSFHRTFFYCNLIMAASTFVNAAGAVGFITDMSGGRMNRLIVIHIVMLAANLLLALLGAALFGIFGVVAAWSITLSAGGLALLWFYLKDHKDLANSKFAVVAGLGVGLVVLALASTVVHFTGEWAVSHLLLLKPH